MSVASRTVGLAMLVGVVIIWVASGVCIQKLIFSCPNPPCQKSESFNSPYFLTYLSTTLFTVYLCGFLFFKEWRDRSSASCADRDRGDLEPLTQGAEFCQRSSIFSFVTHDRADSGEVELQTATTFCDCNGTEQRSAADELEQLTVKQVAKLAAMFCPLWFGLRERPRPCWPCKPCGCFCVAGLEL